MGKRYVTMEVCTVSEINSINNSDAPVTVASLTADFKKLGIESGMLLLTHSSLSALGWVCGGPVAVIQALMAVLGDHGTLVMPAHSGEYSDPANWSHPPVPETWWPIIRANMPAFDPALTPTRGIGTIPETFRKWPGILRSHHPQVSFTALGPLAKTVTAHHSLNYAFGGESPLERVYDLNGYILLLGVGHGNNTSLHLAEYRASYPGKMVERNGAPIMENGQRVWKELKDFNDGSEDFDKIGKMFEASCPEKVVVGRVGLAEYKLMRQRDLVDFAITWMNTNRK
jgi:aminoglycoside 3-N-acetyltransferase